MEPSTTRRLTFLSTLSLRRATVASSTVIVILINFYPRSPCGERQLSKYLVHGQHLFLSTLSLRRATQTAYFFLAGETISIHALLAESDSRQVFCFARQKNFYPRSPCGERHQDKFFVSPAKKISIHALLAESDSKSAQNSGALLRIWNKFYGDCIFMLTGKAVFYPFCPCFFHIFWCEGSGNFMIAFPSH